MDEELGENQQKHSMRNNWLHEVYNNEHCVFYYYLLIVHYTLIATKFVTNVWMYVCIYLYAFFSENQL